MPNLARIYDFTRQKLQRKHLNEEFENRRRHLDAFIVHNPIVGDLDFGGFIAKNFAAKVGWSVVDASRYSTLQDAVDALDQGIVLVPPETWKVGAEPLIIDRDDIWLWGLGWSAKILKDRIMLPRSADGSNFSARGNPAIWFKKAARCRLINLTVDMNQTQGQDMDPFPTSAIHATGCPDFAVMKCHVTNFGDRHFQAEPRGKATATFAALNVENSDRAKVVQNKFTQCRSAAVICGGLDDYQGTRRGWQTIALNEISDCDVGVQITPSNVISVAENRFTNIAGSAVVSTPSSTSTGIRAAEIKVVGNQMYEVGINPDEEFAAIYFKFTKVNLRQVMISRNQIFAVRGDSNVAAHGIWFVMDATSGTTSQVSILKIDRNQMDFVNGQGIHVNWVQGASVSGNDLTELSISGNNLGNTGAGSEAEYDGILVQGTATSLAPIQHTAINDNVIWGGELAHGIRYTVTGGDGGGIIEGNAISNPVTTRQIKVTGARSVVVGLNSCSEAAAVELV